MGDKLQQQLKELGSKLESPPASQDALIKLLKRSSGKKRKLVGGSEQDKKLNLKSPSSQIGKRSRGKNLKGRQRGLWKSTSSVKGRERPDVAESSMADDSDSEREQNGRISKNDPDKELSDNEKKQDEDAEKDWSEAEKHTEEKQEEDDSEDTQSDNVGGSPQDAQGSDDEAVSSDVNHLDEDKEESGDEAEEAKDMDSLPTIKNKPNKKTTSVSGSVDAEVSDDELLSSWKQRVAKK